METHSATPPRLREGATDTGRCTIDHEVEGLDPGFDTNANAEATFPISSHVTSTGSIVTTFLVNGEIVPIKIEKIPGDYRFFNLVFIICV